MGAPYMPLYVADFTNDTAGLPLQALAVWIKCLCLMWSTEQPEVTERSEKHWARRWGCTPDEVAEILDELEQVATVTKHEDGSVSIRSGRMEEELAALEGKREAARNRKAEYRRKKTETKEEQSIQPQKSDVPRSERVPNASVPRSDLPLSLSSSSHKKEEGGVGGEENSGEHWALAMLRSAQGRSPGILALDTIPKQVTDRTAWSAALDRARDRNWVMPFNVAALLDEYRKAEKALNPETDGTTNFNPRPLTKSQQAAEPLEQRLRRQGWVNPV